MHPEAEVWNITLERMEKLTRDLAQIHTTILQGDGQMAIEFCEEARQSYLGASIAHLSGLTSPDGCPIDLAMSTWRSALDQALQLKETVREAENAWLRFDWDIATKEM